ncbi:5-dehydro-2-deoxygluconokinase [Phycicoccus sp. CMS6Z-2]|uniref:5-dehydro-2-deoxygluconokinase n=1 Tax=Phycicoccus flavus TaxID=2502783 RepID=A0A8T6R269_9MICO|nr:5-dehydro-2-deoxygluconokinase [Phycicoccus flavus]
MDLLAIGRVSVDLYAQEAGATFLEPQTFLKSIGGSPTNVAVAGARLGLTSALVTGVGEDPLGDYVLARLEEFGVRTDAVVRRTGGRTPVVLVALEDPAEPTITFLRDPEAPDTTIGSETLDDDALRSAKVLWTSVSTLAAGATADTLLHWLDRRARRPHTVVDLDLRPTLWPDAASAAAAAEQAIALADVVVGNRRECEAAVGTADPDGAADALLDRGVSLAVVKLGADGALLATADERVRVPPVPVDVRCGSGAGDAFGGVLAAGLVRGWPLERIGRLGNAAGALVTSRLTCADAMPTLTELEAFADAALVPATSGDVRA